MKIAVTSAFGWPYVRRGNRVAYELAEYLASRGNEVHFITTKPGTNRLEKYKGNLLIKYYPAIDHPFLTRFNIQYWQTFALTCFKALLIERYDLIYTCLTMDACVAGLNKTIKGTPYIPVLINGDPLIKDARRAKLLFSRAVKKASRLVTISNFVNGILKRDFGIDGIVIPCPLNTSIFYHTGKKKTGFPKILCTATLVMERKRVPLLVKAFEILIEHFPDAILQLAGETTPEVTKNLLISVHSKARESIEFLDITSDKALASIYQDATVTVLPSLEEPFGMVTTESLACGTPVVGTRSGGTPEILDDKEIGVLFEPTDGPDELSKALIKGIELAHDPQTSMRCSRHADRYSWNTLGPKYEELQSEVVGDLKKRSRASNKINSKKISFTSMQKKPVITNGHVHKSVLNKFFTDTLDNLEITTSAYYDFYSNKPKDLHMINWIFNKAKQHDSVLIISLNPIFLALLLKECGVKVRQVVYSSGLNVTNETYLFGTSSDTKELDQYAGVYDIIVCDDILQYLDLPIQFLQMLQKHLKPEGNLLLCTQNASRGVSRLRLLTGKNIYPSFNGNVINSSFQKNEDLTRFYREYTLGELSGLVSNSGFELIEKRCIIGKKNIDKSVNFSTIDVKTYLYYKIYHQIQRLVSPLRSHLFVAARSL